MGLLDQFRTEPLPKQWQDEGHAWQETYFPEMPVVFDEAKWNRYYPATPAPLLTCVQAKPDGFADFSNRVWKADDMPDAQFMMALRIIRAQASTELGSIQQHRMVYEQLDRGSLNGLDR